MNKLFRHQFPGVHYSPEWWSHLLLRGRNDGAVVAVQEQGFLPSDFTRSAETSAQDRHVGEVLQEDSYCLQRGDTHQKHDQPAYRATP